MSASGPSGPLVLILLKPKSLLSLDMLRGIPKVKVDLSAKATHIGGPSIY